MAERIDEPVELHTREPRDERLARELRKQIYAGEYQPGDVLPATAVVAVRHGISRAMAQRAFEILRREGLIFGETGRGTYVCSRLQFTAVVAANAAGRLPTARALADAERAEPAVTDLTVADEGSRRVWRMNVEAADTVPAATVAIAVARAAGAAGRLAVAVEPSLD